MLKTSHEWYEMDHSYDILDPDGWPRSHYGAEAWYFVPITQTEYSQRLNVSTCTSYMKNGHLPAFQKPKDPKPSVFCSNHARHCEICDGPLNLDNDCKWCVKPKENMTRDFGCILTSETWPRVLTPISE